MARKKKKEDEKLFLVLLAFFAFILMVPILLVFLFTAADSTSSTPQVAVIQIHGAVGSREVDLDETLDLLEKARDNPRIGAVVLDINSPGGLPVATREIGEKVKQLKKSKPVIAWIGESGTSGGYWIASTSDWIMADPLSMVGSIGVILEVPNISGLMEKLGVEVVTITGGNYKDIGSPFRNMTNEEKEILENISEQLHQEFMNEISENRNMNETQTTELSDGQIYLGRKALELGLVDELGTRDQAIEKAAELAGIQPKWFYLEQEGLGPLFKEIFPERPFWMP